MSEEQQPRTHAEDPAEGADTDQREAGHEPRVRPQEPAEGPDDETVEGDS